MSETTKTRLFFFKANPSDLKAVETYLAKRDYEVMSESNFNDALAKLIHFDPAFVFIAWDHPHPRIQSIPKFLGQSITATVIPYIESNSRDHLRVLESSGFSLKIYPPVSGPAIIRTILKIEKEFQQASDEIKRISNIKEKTIATTFVNSKKKTEAVQNFLQELEKEDARNSSSLIIPSKPPEKSIIHIQKGNRGALINYNKSRLESLAKKSNLEKLESSTKEALQLNFQNKVKNQILDLTLSYAETESVKTVNAATENIADSFKKLLCLVVQSESWCGYLVIASQNQIKDNDYQTILQNWLQDQFINMNEISENDYFEIQLQNKDVDLKLWAQKNSDYLEVIETEKSEVLLSFFSIDPKYLILELNESAQMLEVPLQLVTPDQKIELSLFLHLPDNKKYILYTPAHQALSSLQKNKLLEKSIEQLHTPMSFEKELNKLKAEYYLNDSVNKIKQALT